MTSIPMACYMYTDPTIDISIQKFWELENVHKIAHLSSENRLCETNYNIKLRQPFKNENSNESPTLLS